jgi:hypothetical protein
LSSPLGETLTRKVTTTLAKAPRTSKPWPRFTVRCVGLERLGASRSRPRQRGSRRRRRRRRRSAGNLRLLPANVARRASAKVARVAERASARENARGSPLALTDLPAELLPHARDLTSGGDFFFCHWPCYSSWRRCPWPLPRRLSWKSSSGSRAPLMLLLRLPIPLRARLRHPAPRPRRGIPRGRRLRPRGYQ